MLVMEMIPFQIASKTLGALSKRAAVGEQLVITRYGRPIAVLGPITDEVRAQLNAADDDGRPRGTTQ